jgi:membrane protein YqaA with SNARE-associated domain
VIGYAGLFAAAFVAASLLPAQSELVLAAMIAAGRHDPTMLLIVATVGNVSGSIVNWAIGRFLSVHRDAKWFPVSAKALDRAERWYGRWGLWTLLLSWVPIVGDPLTLVAGLLRAPLLLFVAVVTLAKGARYVFVAAAVLGFM